MLWLPRILLIAFICTIALAQPVPDDPEEDNAIVEARSPCFNDLKRIIEKILGGKGGKGKGKAKGKGDTDEEEDEKDHEELD
ncbi:uncharacterized protein LOC117570118 isoform X4 [Drosophila albomicans]|uniref:Uncharacterized protein LOC117570118 isoform X4 n=1 Tax=Drosophila albomicans TaxID=7291 RepID=A0A9C6T333_DROAB|nr:uncharacterized protein LOC117570118 isoform X4 [Drosophila albomicans]